MLLVDFFRRVWDNYTPYPSALLPPFPIRGEGKGMSHWICSLLPLWKKVSKKRVRGVLITLLTLPLTACFQPLYGPQLLGAENSQLSNIEVAEIPDRIGHFLHAELQFQLGGGKIPYAPVYRLEVKTRSSTQIAIVNRNADRADSASNVVYADYIMFAKDGSIFAQGSVTAVASYDRSAQQFANLRASRNAEERTAKLLAEQIKIRVAAALASRK